MTAHVQADSQELSFQSGMDEHVSKPVNFYELRAIIDHLMARRSPGSFAPSPQPPEQPLQEASRQALDSSLQEAPPQAPETSIHDAPRQPPVIDEKNALLRMGNDQNLFNDLLLIFYRDLPHRIERLQQAVETGAMEDLRKYAHSLKGTAGTLGAAQCSQTARELEKAAKEDDRETTKLVFQTLYEELRALHTALGSILATRGLIDPESVGRSPER
jgi:HPt (histidine-containing phosphotransfer) domain-containing protein